MNPMRSIRKMSLAIGIFLLTSCLFLCGQLSAEIIECDICVYGGTSGGVMAAVQAARMGKSVVLAEFGRHLGGMTSGGLGRTDTGNTGAIGGLSREFYRRVGRYYGQSESFTFEPHVAEEVFRAMLQELHVPVYYEQRLASITQDGQRLTEIAMENGNVFRARIFIDASYESDLMALASVNFAWGREANSVYAETLNGVRANTPAHQFALDVDPYQTPGDPGSGLLPYIQPGDGGVPGEGDQRIQAYNFRLCLTQNSTNKIPITAPSNYNAVNYELLGRYIQARVAAGHSLTLGSFLKIDMMPNGKTDINNNGAFSTDFIGQNYDYPNGSYAMREAIWNDTLQYINGLLHFLATDSRVPSIVQTNMQSWGLAQDEFADTGGWPHQMYVREARRMVSDYVMTEHDCRGTIKTTNSVGLASYNMDSHNCQRVVQNGYVRNEGDFQVGVAPFPIAYASLVPARGQCDNLFVTFGLSASHVAFASVRMEPVFMILNQSAATAAAFAIDDNLAVQDVPYYKLRLQLLADRQILDWSSGGTSTNGVIVDNEHPTGVSIVGGWPASASTPGYYGTNYLHDGNTSKGTKSVRFTPSLPAAGTYTVYLRWTAHSNRATNVPVTITHANGVTNLTVNQTQNGGVWFPLGSFSFDTSGAGNLLIETTGTARDSGNGYVVADSALWEPVTAPPPPTVDVIASDSSASEDDLSPAAFTFVRSGDTRSALNVVYSISGTATPGVDYVQPTGSLLIPAGQIVASLAITPLPDSLPEGDENVSLTLLTNADYQLGLYTNSTVVLHDGGFGGWRGSHFTAEELLNLEVSGERADPDLDHIPNLLEFFHGSEPKSSNIAPALRLEQDTNGWHLDWRRHQGAASLYLRLENSTDLALWSPAPFAAQVYEVADAPPCQDLRFPLQVLSTNTAQIFYRVAVSQTPLALTTNEAHLFFSFDTQPDGLGLFTDTVTANDGFYGTPVVSRVATAIEANGNGGASSFTDFAGLTWLGSGTAASPGHSLTFNPGSVNNQMSLSFSTIGLRNVRLRFDLRSATQSGGTPPTTFTSFTYDVGGGPITVPAAALTFPADNTFQEWTADLSAITALENQPTLTLRWTFEDLASSPPESVRMDNIQVSASPINR